MIERIKTLLGLQSRSLDQVPIDSPDAYSILVGSNINGLPINERAVLGIPAVRRALDLVSGGIGCLDCDVYQRLPEGGRIKYKSHPAYHLLRWSPNEYFTAQTFIEGLVFQLLLHGNAYAFIWRNAAGDPVELDLIPSDWVQPFSQDGKLQYRIYRGPEMIVAQPKDIIHVKKLAPDGLTGYSVLTTLAEALAENLSIQRYTTNFFRNGAQPGMVVQVPMLMQDSQAVETFMAGIRQAQSGLAHSHKTMLLQNGATLADNKVSHEALQLVELKQAELLAIANIVGINPHKIGYILSSSYASVEAENKSFLTDTLRPIITSLQREFRQKLCRAREIQWDTVTIEFDLGTYLTGDPARLIEAQTDQIYLSAGVISADEVRAKLNLPPKPEEEDIDKPDTEPEPEAPDTALEQVLPTMPARSQQDAIDKLLDATLQRLGTRLQRSQKGATDQRELSDWADLELPQHRGIMQETLQPILAVCCPGAEAAEVTQRIIDHAKQNPQGLDRMIWKNVTTAV